jgi:hypothetical protein
VVDDSGQMFVGNGGNCTVDRISPSGERTVLAGKSGVPGTEDGIGSAARFTSVWHLAIDDQGVLYASDLGAIRRITPAGEVTTIAGKVENWGSEDGPGTAARFSWRCALAAESGGTVFVADGWNCTIRRISPEGEVTTLAGRPGIGGSADGTGKEARFSTPYGVAVDKARRIYVSFMDGARLSVSVPTLPDAPVIDLARGPVGQTRQLSVTNTAGTAWK